MSKITKSVPIIVGGKITDVEVTLTEDEWEGISPQQLQARHGDAIAHKPKPKAKKASA